MDISLILESPLVQALLQAGIFLFILHRLGALPFFLERLNPTNLIKTVKGYASHVRGIIIMPTYKDLVGKAVAEFRQDQRTSGENLIRAHLALSVIPLDELLAELSVRMEKITYGQDVPGLIAAASPPLPENPEALVDIVRRNDLTALRKIFLNGYADGDPSRLIASMVGVVAKLEEVRARAG